MAIDSELPQGLTLGSPCWLSIASANPDTTRSFYAELFHWQYKITAPGHTVATLDGVPVAAINDASARFPESWMLHLAMRNPWIAVERVEHYGGRVIHGPEKRSDGSSFVLATDHEGTAIALLHPNADWHFRVNEPGSFVWADLNTHDGKGTDRFFRGLFGYEQGQVGDGTVLDYTIWWQDNKALLGRYLMGSEFPASTKSHWTVFFQVFPELGTDATAELAQRLDGKIIVAPYYSSYGRAAVLADPTGAQFSIIERTSDDDEPRAEVDDPYDD